MSDLKGWFWLNSCLIKRKLEEERERDSDRDRERISILAQKLPAELPIGRLESK